MSHSYVSSELLERLNVISQIQNNYDRVDSLLSLLIEEEYNKLNGSTPKPKTYNHALSVVFTISGSTDPNGEDITPDDLIEALTKRLEDLRISSDEEVMEAIMPPHDSYEED